MQELQQAARIADRSNVMHAKIAHVTTVLFRWFYVLRHPRSSAHAPKIHSWSKFDKLYRNEAIERRLVETDTWQCRRYFSLPRLDLVRQFHVSISTRRSPMASLLHNFETLNNTSFGDENLSYQKTIAIHQIWKCSDFKEIANFVNFRVGGVGLLHPNPQSSAPPILYKA